MRLFAGANPVRVMASGAIDVNHKDEIYDGKVIMLCIEDRNAIHFVGWIVKLKSQVFSFVS